ncbi:MAG: hypothetical protein PHE09_16795 [Oscillospiraceae bacterium]|nr:hypothetical protein [Oscillospiraceae bacterium]
MEKRLAKVNISSAGGTAAKGSRTCKVTLPTAWLEEIGIGENCREVLLSFDGTQITVARRLNGEEFVAQKHSLRHDVRLLRFYDEHTLCTTLFVDFTDQTLVVENHIADPVKTAFGRNTFPTWEDFKIFLEDRCVPHQRSGLREYLESKGIAEYSPLAIIEKTAGRMAEDNQWLEMEEYK